MMAIMYKYNYWRNFFSFFLLQKSYGAFSYTNWKQNILKELERMDICDIKDRLKFIEINIKKQDIVYRSSFMTIASSIIMSFITMLASLVISLNSNICTIVQPQITTTDEAKEFQQVLQNSYCINFSTIGEICVVFFIVFLFIFFINKMIKKISKVKNIFNEEMYEIIDNAYNVRLKIEANKEALH